MKSTLNFFTILGLFLSLTACSPHAPDDSKIKEEGKKIDQELHDIENGKAVTLDDPALRDMFHRGGQPGDIHLAGALVVDENSLDQRLEVNQQAGQNWRGTAEPLRQDALKTQLTLDDDSLKAIQSASEREDVMNFGCDPSRYQESHDLKAANPILQTDLVLIANAKVILLCDSKMLDNKAITISADTIILSNFHLKTNGAAQNSVTLQTRRLILNGQNAIQSIGADNIQNGPNLTLETLELKGEGTLNLYSLGYDDKP